MAFVGPVATGIIELEIQPPNAAAIQAAAQQAAQNFSESFKQSMKGLDESLKPFKGAITGAALGITALTAVSVKLGESFAKTAGNFQELQQSINAIITNSKTAKTSTDQFINSIRTLAIQSGRSSQELANTGRQFLALGFSGAKTTEILTAFTKAASLTGATNEQLKLALNGVSQIASKGAVSMEELRRQIAENLPGAVSLTTFFEILAKQMGITVEEAKKLQSQGLIGAKEGIDALIETVNTATSGIDVFALRAKTLNGLLGIMKEGFTQAVQTGFQPFITALTQTTSGPLGEFINSLKTASSGGGGVSDFQKLIERFAKTLGVSFRDILNQIIPLIPQLANLFVTLVEAFAPVVVDVVRIGTNIARILLPALNAAAIALRTLFNDLGPVSFLLRQLAAGALLGGLANALGAVGRALGSFGGFIGRIATPLSRILEPLAQFATQTGVISSVLGVLSPVLSAIAKPLGFLVTALGAAALAFKLFHAQEVIVAGFTSINAAISVVTSLFARLPNILAEVTLSLRAAVIEMGAFKAAAIATGIGALTVLIGGLTVALNRMDEAAKKTLDDLQQGIDRTNTDSLNDGIAKMQAKIKELEPQVGSLKDQLISLTNAPGEESKTQQQINKIQEAIDSARVQGILLKSVFSAVSKSTGASFDEISAAASRLGINLSNIKGAGELATIDKLVKDLTKDMTAEGRALSALNTAFDKTLEQQDKLLKAQKAVDDAQKGVVDAKQKEKDARENVVEVTQREVEVKEKLQEITDKLTKLELDRQKLINDTTSDIREIQDAERDLEKIGFRLLDIDDDRRKTLEKIKELQTGPTADEVTSADNKITRATLALNDAKREEEELLKSLNKEQQQGVDLSGLTLDQLRTRLADIRASLAAQRAVKKNATSQEQIQEQITTAHLNTVDAQISLNEAIAARQNLDQIVINNQSEIESLTRHIKELEADKRSLLNDQIVAQDSLNKLRDGETTRAQNIKNLDEQIANLKRDQKNTAFDLVTAHTNIQKAQDAVKIATQGIRDAENEVKIAKADQALNAARILGSERDINNALLERIGINARLVGQTPELLAASLQTALPILFAGNPALPFVTGNPQFARQVADLILNNPNKLRDLFRSLGVKGFAEGGLITHPMLATIGERFKHEMVLPLTKPDRVWTLLSQNLPKYPGAFKAAQSALSGPMAPAIPKVVQLGGKRVQNRDDGPMTFKQAQEIIRLLSEHKTEVHVDAPITVENRSGDADLLAKKVSRQVEKNVLDKLMRR